MPIEVLMLEGRSEPFTRCPHCGAEPFYSFLRGHVQRRPYGWRTLWLPIGKPRPYCAVTCAKCNDIVGWELP